MFDADHREVAPGQRALHGHLGAVGEHAALLGETFGPLAPGVQARGEGGDLGLSDGIIEGV